MSALAQPHSSRPRETHFSSLRLRSSGHPTVPSSPDGGEAAARRPMSGRAGVGAVRWWWWCSSGPTALPPALPRGARPACRIQARCGGAFSPHEGLPGPIPGSEVTLARLKAVPARGRGLSKDTHGPVQAKVIKAITGSPDGG